MTQIPADWLREHGVDEPAEDLELLSQHCEEALEFRVGTSLAEIMTEESLAKFEAAMDDDATEAERLAVLEAAVPGYKHVVIRETEALKQNIIRADDPVAYIRGLKV